VKVAQVEEVRVIDVRVVLEEPHRDMCAIFGSSWYLGVGVVLVKEAYGTS